VQGTSRAIVSTDHLNVSLTVNRSFTALVVIGSLCLAMGIFGVSSYMVNGHGTSVVRATPGLRAVAAVSGCAALLFAGGIWRKNSLPWDAVYPGLGLAWIVIASIGIRILAVSYSGTPCHQRVIWIGVGVLAAGPVLVHFIRRVYDQHSDNPDQS
jgi:hypothetical protein